MTVAIIICITVEWEALQYGKIKCRFTGLVPFDDGEMYKEITPEGYVEGPFMLKKDGKYYFMWSEGGWGRPDYSVRMRFRFSICPFKPCVAKILEQDSTVATSAGHHSVIHIPGSDDYYMVYQAPPGWW